MDKLVVANQEEMEIGKVYKGLQYGPWYEPEPEQCYKVVAVDSEQGWIDCLVSFHGEKERPFAEMQAAVGGPWFYYEIQTD